MPKLYWNQEGKEDYDDIQDFSDQELLDWLAEVAQDSGDSNTHNVMFELSRRLNHKNKTQTKPANILDKDFWRSSGFLIETDDDFVYEYPSMKKIKIDKRGNDLFD